MVLVNYQVLSVIRNTHNLIAIISASPVFIGVSEYQIRVSSYDLPHFVVSIPFTTSVFEERGFVESIINMMEQKTNPYLIRKVFNAVLDP